MCDLQEIKFNKLFLSLYLNKIKYNKNLFTLPLCDDKQDLSKIEFCLKSKNLNLIIFQDMGLGIFLTDYSLNKLPFFNTMKYTELKKNFKYYNIRHGNVTKKINSSGCKIFTFNDKWSTSSWDYIKLSNIDIWINYLFNDQQVDLERFVPINDYTNKKLLDLIDLEFARAMGCLVDN